MSKELKVTVIRAVLALPGDLVLLGGKHYEVVAMLSSTEYIVRPINRWSRFKNWLGRLWHSSSVL